MGVGDTLELAVGDGFCEWVRDETCDDVGDSCIVLVGDTSVLDGDTNDAVGDTNECVGETKDDVGVGSAVLLAVAVGVQHCTPGLK